MIKVIDKFENLKGKTIKHMDEISMWGEGLILITTDNEVSIFESQSNDDYEITFLTESEVLRKATFDNNLAVILDEHEVITKEELDRIRLFEKEKIDKKNKELQDKRDLQQLEYLMKKFGKK